MKLRGRKCKLSWSRLIWVWINVRRNKQEGKEKVKCKVNMKTQRNLMKVNENIEMKCVDGGKRRSEWIWRCWGDGSDSKRRRWLDTRGQHLKATVEVKFIVVEWFWWSPACQQKPFNLRCYFFGVVSRWKWNESEVFTCHVGVGVAVQTIIEMKVMDEY